MKKVMYSLAVLLVAAGLQAQEGSNGFLLTGSVIYEQAMKLDIQLEGDGGQFADLLPDEKKSEKILHFSPEASLYENFKDGEEEELMDMGGGGQVMVKIAEPDNKLYTDLQNGQKVEQKEFMSRTFLIEAELSKFPWKLTGAQRSILEYNCQEAELNEEDRHIRVWFTPSISVPAGPSRYNQLPGLILAVDINDGEQTLMAKKVHLHALEEGVLVKPRKGKKISEEEFDAIVEEKMKEMGGEGGGSGEHVIMIKVER